MPPYLIEANLRSLLAKRESLEAALLRYRQANIKQVIVFTDASTRQGSDALQHLRLKLRASGSTVQFWASRLLRKTDARLMSAIDRMIQSSSVEEPCLFLCSDEHHARLRELISGEKSPGQGPVRVDSEQHQDAPASSPDQRALPEKRREAESIAVEATRAFDTTSPTTQGQDDPAERIEKPRFSIRFKLLGIVSVIVLAALGAVVYLATSLFRTDIEIRVQHQTLRMAELIAARMELEIASVAVHGRLLAGDRIARPDAVNEFNRLTNMIYIGRLESTNSERNQTGLLYRDEFLNLHGLSRRDIENHVSENLPRFRLAARGDTPVINLSTASIPLLGLAFPLEDKPGAAVIVVLDYANFLSTFRDPGPLETLIVTNEGDTIAHSDTQLVLANADLSDLEIVRRMQESPVPAQQVRYLDRNGVPHLAAFQKIDHLGLGLVCSVDERDALLALFELQERIIYLSLLVLGIAILCVIAFSRTLTTPILRLTEAARSIEEGDYDISLKTARRDELGMLTGSFRHMVRGLRERDRVMRAFSKFVSEEVAARAVRGELTLGGERRNCAVLFSDIRDFTSISEQLSPETVMELLNDYFIDMVNWILITRGIVDKFLGDALMAHWGALTDIENPTENAINAALLMREALVFINKRTVGTGRPPLRMGCGINTGPVIAGQVGSEQRYEYTVIGDTVNLASRIEGLNKRFGTDILVTEAAMSHVKGIFSAVPLEAVRVRGKADEITIYAVLGRADDPGTPRNLAEVRERYGVKAPG